MPNKCKNTTDSCEKSNLRKGRGNHERQQLPPTPRLITANVDRNGGPLRCPSEK